MSPALANAIFWIAAAGCAVAQVALIVSSIRSPMSAPSESSAVPLPRRSTEIAWTIVPAIALALLLFFTWRAMHPPAAPADPHAGHAAHP